MIRRISSTRATSLASTNVSRLRSVLRVGDILPAKIIDGLGEGRYIVEVKGQQVLAESQLNLDNKRHYIQVEALKPKINLRLVSLNSGDTTEQLIDSASKWGIPLNIFNQYVLDRLYRRNPKRRKDPSKLLSFLLELSSLRETGDLIDFDDWIDILDEMDESDILLLLAHLRGGIESGKGTSDLRQLPEEIIYLLYQLSGSDDDNVLSFVNRLLEKKNKRIYGWMFPSGPVTIEKAISSESGSIVYQMNYKSKMLDRIRIRLTCLGREKALTLGFTNSIVSGEFQKRIEAIRPLLTDISMIRTEILTVQIPSYLMDGGSFYL